MNGSCKCGSVKFVAGDPLQVVNCHCNLCRSINGSAFSSYVVTRLSEFKVETDNTALGAYAAGEHAIKHFCSTCGTPIYNNNAVKYPGLAMVHLGVLKEHDQMNPAMNIYCSSKLNWVDAISAIHSFAEAPQRS